ncbi:hypothetical protein TNCV_4919361 [Trichonephila clavipes]|nr:hypothetical protein TNCV_4919361 [Trichonephila clavipes]
MESMRLLITSWGIMSHSSRRALSSSWRVLGVVGGYQLVFLERPKRALLDKCLENSLAIPLVRFLPRKGNPPPGYHDVACIYRPLKLSHLQLLQRKGLQ